MADNNNALIGKLPKEPYPELKKLESLVGKWHIETNIGMEGYAAFEWMEGGFFMIQRFEFKIGDGNLKGIEYIGFDEDTQTLRSHMMDITGSNFTYTWDIVDDEMWYWFGEKGSDTFSHGKFSEDGNTVTGSWKMPHSNIDGYDYSMTRVK